jgi:hypothetical protein
MITTWRKVVRVRAEFGLEQGLIGLSRDIRRI